MSKQQVQAEFEEAQEDDLDIESTDYGFIFDEEGNLKHMFTPDGFELDPPKIIRKILKMLGIDDINAVAQDEAGEYLH